MAWGVNPISRIRAVTASIWGCVAWGFITTSIGGLLEGSFLARARLKRGRRSALLPPCATAVGTTSTTGRSSR